MTTALETDSALIPFRSSIRYRGEATVRASSIYHRSAPPVVYLPVGSTGQVQIEGGSGAYRFETAEGLVWDDGLFIGETPGVYPVRIVDRNADRHADFTVSVIGSLQAESRPLNDHSLSERIKNAGDLNGDGG